MKGVFNSMSATNCHNCMSYPGGSLTYSWNMFVDYDECEFNEAISRSKRRSGPKYRLRKINIQHWNMFLA